jgi:uncharacterized protein YecE (DUF72 family)
MQSTFYKLPKSDTVTRWRTRMGDGFTFTMKAYQALTHPYDSPTWTKRGSRFPPGNPERFGSLRPTEENFEIWEQVIHIGKELGTEFVVVQLPPSFINNSENLGNLVAFFGSVERPFTVGIELRHTSWFEEPAALGNILERLGLTDVLDPFRRNPVNVGNTAYFRLHGLARNYRYTFTQGDLFLLKKKVESLQVDLCYVFFNNITMAQDAKRFEQLLNAG